MTSNGRYTAFVSAATNLVKNDINGLCDVFVRDRKKETTTLVSINSYGQQAVAPPSAVSRFSPSVAMSLDGNLVVFTSDAPNLVPGDTDIFLYDTFVHNMKTETTRLVSTAADDTTKKDILRDFHNTFGPAISGNGRYASFLAGFQDGAHLATLPRAYVKDLKTGALQEIKDPPAETPETPRSGKYGQAFGSSLDRTGNILALTTGPTNAGAFISGDPTATPSFLLRPRNVFIVDRRSGKAELACLRPDGERGTNDTSYAQGPAITPDGRYLLFQSSDAAWVPNDSNSVHFGNAGNVGNDEFVCDLTTGRVHRVNVTSSGGEMPASTGSRTLALSPDGRYVEYMTLPLNLPPYGGGCVGPVCDVPAVDPDGSPTAEIYVYDTEMGTRELLTRRTTADGPQGCAGLEAPSWAGPLSLNARYAAFWSCDSNIVEGDSNDNWDLFVRDRGEDLFAAMGGPEQTFEPSDEICVSEDLCIPPLGTADNKDGRSDVSSALTELGANLYGLSVANRSQSGDLFVRAELDEMPAVNGIPSSGAAGLLYGLDLEAGGTSYQVRAQRIPGPDFDPEGGASFGLFKKDPATGLYTKVAALRGGYGTTGVEIVFAIPFSAIGLEVGAEMSNVTAFTGFGSYLSGPSKVLDTVALDVSS